MSLYQGLSLLGASIGPAIGGFIGYYVNYRSPFILLGIMSFICGLFVYIKIPESRVSSSSMGDQSSPWLKKEAHKFYNFSDAKGDLKVLLKNRNFLLVSIIAFGIFFTRSGAKMTIIPLLGYNEIGLDEKEVGIVMSLIALGNFLTIYPSGLISDRFGRKKAIVPGIFLSGISLLLFSLCGNLTSFVIIGALLGLGTGIGGPAPMAYAMDISSGSNYGLLVGLYRTIGDIGYVLGPLLLGQIADLSGYNIAIITNGLLLLLGSIIFWLFAEEKR